MTTIKLHRLNDAFHFEAIDESGNKMEMDASPEMGGTHKGMCPMEMLLAAMGGCSSMDITNILKKQKQDLKDINVTVTGEREQGVIPSLYTTVHVHFKFYGILDQEKVTKAVAMSVDKYCPVARTLEPKAKITHSFEIIPA